MSGFWNNISLAQDGGDATWQILLMLLVAFVLGYLLRFFISRSKYGKLSGEITELQSSNKRLRDQLDAQKKKLDSAEDVEALKSEINALKRTNSQLNRELGDCRKRADETAAIKPPVNPVSTDVAAVTKATISASQASASDDLTKIEGVGRKIQEHLNNGGVKSYADLAAATVHSLKEILDKAGPAYTMHDPGTWPEQAALAQKGKWEELRTWQSQLKGGRKRKKR